MTHHSMHQVRNTQPTRLESAVCAMTEGTKTPNCPVIQNDQKNCILYLRELKLHAPPSWSFAAPGEQPPSFPNSFKYIRNLEKVVNHRSQGGGQGQAKTTKDVLKELVYEEKKVDALYLTKTWLKTWLSQVQSQHWHQICLGRPIRGSYRPRRRLNHLHWYCLQKSAFFGLHLAQKRS